MAKPRLLIFASGTKDGGGSGFRELIENSRTGVLDAEIIGVVSNHEWGGVRQIADNYRIPFFLFYTPYIAECYRGFVEGTETEWIALSGWLKPVVGLDPTKTFNIHPGPLPEFGGKGMYGHHVHEAVMKAFEQKKIIASAVCMHFVTEEYDEGPIFFWYPVLIRNDDTAETLVGRVNKIEHGWQSFITNLVAHGEISWNGKDEVVVPDWYKKEKFCPARLKMG